MPVPNFGAAGQTDNNFIAPAISPITQDVGTIRADYTVNSTTQAFVRFTRQQAARVRWFPDFGVLVFPGSSIAVGNSEQRRGKYYPRIQLEPGGRRQIRLDLERMESRFEPDQSSEFVRQLRNSRSKRRLSGLRWLGSASRLGARLACSPLAITPMPTRWTTMAATTTWES